MKKRLLFLVLMLLVLSAATGAAPANYPPARMDGDSQFTHTLNLTEDPFTLGYNIAYKFSVTEDGYPKGIWQTIGSTPNEIYDATGFVSGYPKITDSAKYTAGDDFGVTHKKTTTIPVDWSGVTFSEPGVYFWEVKEEIDWANTNAPDDEKLDKNPKNYYIWAYVTDENQDGTLEVHAGQLLADSQDIKPNSKKDPVRNYPATTVDLEIKKTVSGSQGSRDQYFPFTVQITEAGYSASHLYDVSGNYTKQNDVIISSPYYKGEPAVTQPEGQVNLSGSTHSFTVWLKHGEDFKISGLPYGSSYTISEVADGYTTSIDITNGDTTDAEKSDKSISDPSLTYTQGTTTVKFNNERDGDIPTGIEMETGAPIIGLLLAAGLLALVFMPKRREENR